MPELDQAVPGGVGETIERAIDALRADGPLVTQLLGGDARRIERAMPQDAADEPIMVAVEAPAEAGEWHGAYARERHLVQVAAVAEADWHNDSAWGLGDILDRASLVLRGGVSSGLYPGGQAGGSSPQRMEDGRVVATRSYRIVRYVAPG